MFYRFDFEFEEKNIFLKIIGGGPSLTLFCMNLLVMVKLGYTPNFEVLGYLEVP